jgi:hypothetical protein
MAEIHSSFEEVMSGSYVERPQYSDGDAAEYIIPPEAVSDVTTE